jgi:hypothetical protein
LSACTSRPGIERDADELAPHRPRHRLAERSLAHAWRPEEAEDGTLQIAAQLADGEELQHPLLHLLEPVVIGFERAPRVVHVEVVLGGQPPGHVRDPLQPGARDVPLLRAFGQLPEACELLVQLRADVGGQLERGDLLGELVVGAVGAFAQLGLDRLQLLAEHVLPLCFRDALLHGALDVVGRLEDFAAPREQRHQEPQALRGIERFQDALLLHRRRRDVVREQVGQRARVPDLLDAPRDVLRHAGQEREDVARQLARLEGERFDFRPRRRRHFDELDAAAGQRLLVVQLQHTDAALHRDEHAAVRRDAFDLRQRCDRVHSQLRVVGAQRHGDAALVAREQLASHRCAFLRGLQARDRAGEQDAVLQHEYGKPVGKVLQVGFLRCRT